MTIVGYSGNWNVKCECYELANSVDIANNRSIVRVDIYVGRNADTNPSYFGGWLRGSVTVDGQTQNFSGSADESGVSAGEYRYVHVTLDYLIPHNSDGSKTVGISFNWEAYFNPTSASGSGTLDLTTIPRKTDCPTLTAIVKTPTYLTIYPKAYNTFQHSLQIFYGNLSYYVNANGNMQVSEYRFPTNVTSIPITLPKEFYNQFSTISGQGTLRLRTYNNGNYLDQSDATLYVNVNQDLCRPSITSYTSKDINKKTLAITNNQFDTIQYASRINFNISEYYISDPEDINTTLPYKVINGTDYSIPASGEVTVIEPPTNTFTVTLRNSRGVTGQSEIKNNGLLLPYTPLTFNIESLKRTEPTTGEVEISYNGNYYAKPFLQKEFAYFQVGDEMTTENVEIHLPDNFYEQMPQTETWNTFITGSTCDVVEIVNVFDIPDNKVRKHFGLLIYGEDYTLTDIPYEVDVTYQNGNIIDINVVANSKTINVSVGEIESINTTNLFYEYIFNMDGTGEIYTLDNNLTLTWQYREKGSNTWLTGGTLTPTINTNNNTYNGYESLGTIFNYQKQYEFLFTAEDLIFNSNGDGTVEYPINPIQVMDSVSRGYPVIWWTEDSVHILGDVYVTGDVHSNVSL